MAVLCLRNQTIQGSGRSGPLEVPRWPPQTKYKTGVLPMQVAAGYRQASDRHQQATQYCRFRSGNRRNPSRQGQSVTMSKIEKDNGGNKTFWGGGNTRCELRSITKTRHQLLPTTRSSSSVGRSPISWVVLALDLRQAAMS